MTLRGRTVTAVRWTTFGSAFSAGLQIAQVVVLARVLAPEDFGLLAMVSVVLAFSVRFSDFGVNSAFVQRRDVSHAQRSSLFWFNVAGSAVLMTLLMLASPLIAGFFGDARVGPVMQVIAVTLPLNALGEQLRLAAEKALDFQRVMIVQVVSGVSAFVVALTAALCDWGVYALVAGAIANSLVATLLAWVWLADGWRPAWRLRSAEVREFLGFGGAVVASDLVNQVNLTLDLLLAGRLLSAEQLGLYSVPRNLALQAQMVVNRVVTRVAFPLIAEVHEDRDRVRLIYLKMMNLTASTYAPLFVGIAFFAPEIVHVFFGAGWERSAMLLQILSLWVGVRATGNPVGSLLFGMGRADLALKWNLGILVLAPAFVWYGSLHGPEGTAWSMLALSALLFVPGWFLLVRPLCGARFGDYLSSVSRPFMIALAAIAPMAWLGGFLENEVLRLLLGVLLGAPLYLGLSYLGNRSWFMAMRELLGR